MLCVQLSSFVRRSTFEHASLSPLLARATAVVSDGRALSPTACVHDAFL
jgi:hypothetical protein